MARPLVDGKEGLDVANGETPVLSEQVPADIAVVWNGEDFAPSN